MKDTLHPSVVAIYFVGVLAFNMLAFQPVYLLLTLVAGVAYNVRLRGVHAAARSLAWQLPLFALVALLNPIISPIGATVIARVAGRTFYLESLLYGTFMGVMLVSVLTWFSNAGNVLTSDKITMLTGNVMATVGLMISMVMRLVPHFVQRGRLIADTQAMNSAAAQGGERGRVRSALRQVSVLMGWGMEDSLETAQAMRARGWQASNKRTTYKRYRFRATDAAALAGVVALIVMNAYLFANVHGAFRFYATVTGFVVHWSYAVYALFVFLPLIVEGIERLTWMRSR